MATDYYGETNGMMAPFDVVLSGPISGTDDAAARFARAYAAVRQTWFAKRGELPNVWNPMMLPQDRDYEWYMRRCHDAIFDSPECILAQMEGWERSEGSRSEHALCVCLGRMVMKHEEMKV